MGNEPAQRIGSPLRLTVMIYRAVRAVHRGYALTLFWLYVGLFGVAFLLIFILPPATIALLFLGIFGLAFAWTGNLLLGAVGDALARKSLKRAICPHCQVRLEGGAASDRNRAQEGDGPPLTVSCIHCGRCFEPSGAVVEELGDRVALSGFGP